LDRSIIGYEYNFKDYAINLILGSNKWKTLLDNAQSAARALPSSSVAVAELLESNVVTLTSMLQSAHEEACAFAISSRPFWLYF
jgi:hypothetical protein